MEIMALLRYGRHIHTTMWNHLERETNARPKLTKNKCIIFIWTQLRPHFTSYYYRRCRKSPFFTNDNIQIHTFTISLPYRDSTVSTFPFFSHRYGSIWFSSRTKLLQHVVASASECVSMRQQICSRIMAKCGRHHCFASSPSLLIEPEIASKALCSILVQNA